MEEKLFWIGLGLAAHYYATRRLAARLKDAAFARGWHLLTMALVGAACGAMFMVAMDSRRGVVVTLTLLTGRQALAGLAGAAAGLLWGAYESFRRQKNPADALPALDLERSETIFSACLLASVFMYFIGQAFVIPSGSMRLTLLEGDHLAVNKLVYGLKVPYRNAKILQLREVKRGDMIVFRFPTEDPAREQCGGSQYAKDFIKRVVGLPGEEVELRRGKVFVNGAELAEPYTQQVDERRYPPLRADLPRAKYQALWEEGRLAEELRGRMRDDFGPVTVPAGSYLALGDNRDRSCDSRYWGPVPLENIKGKPLLTFWPPSRATLH